MMLANFGVEYGSKAQFCAAMRILWHGMAKGLETGLWPSNKKKDSPFLGCLTSEFQMY